MKADIDIIPAIAPAPVKIKGFGAKLTVIAGELLRG